MISLSFCVLLEVKIETKNTHTNPFVILRLPFKFVKTD